VIDSVKSQAVVLYTSSGRSPFPRSDPEAVRNMPVANAADLVGYVEALLRDVFDTFPLSWQGPHDNLDPAQAVAEVAKILIERHPELDPEAAAALAWVWSYSAWK
jgi:hypothetical protein